MRTRARVERIPLDEVIVMNVKNWMPGVALLPVLALPVSGMAQESHAAAKAQQTRSDHRHHTGAKIVGGSAAGGAVVGGLLGGGKGALIGAGAGAVGGVAVNKHREHKDIRKRQEGVPR